MKIAALLNQLAIGVAPVFYKLLAMSLSSLAVGLVVLAVRRMFRHNLPPIWRYMLWGVVVLALILPWRPSCPISLAGPIQEIEEIRTRDRFSMNSPQDVETAVVQNTSQQEIIQHNQTTSHHNFVLDVALPITWLIGMLGMLIGLFIGKLRFAHRIRSCIKTQNAFLSMVTQCSKELGVKQSIPVVIQDYVDSPALTGILHPKILLPDYTDRMTPQTLRFVLLHELGHYKRKDLWMNELLLLLQCVYWFNPLVWVLFRQMRQDMELLNDSYLLKKLGQEQRRAYSQSLVEVLGLTHHVNRMSPMVCMTEGCSDTQRRIAMMKKQGFFYQHRKSIGVGCTVLIVALILLFLTTAPKSMSAEDAVDALVDSIQEQDYIISFQLPKEYKHTEDWSIQVSGRAEFADGMSMSLHFLEGTLWKPGVDYTVDVSELADAEMELTLYVDLKGVQRDIDLMAYLPQESDDSDSASGSEQQADANNAVMPNIVGDEQSRATDMLEQEGIPYTVELLENDRRWLPGIVLRTSIPAGQDIETDQTVTVYVSDQQVGAGQLGEDEYQTLDFLTAEQRELYQQAQEAAYIIMANPLKVSAQPGSSEGAAVPTEAGAGYILIEGANRDYNLFCQKMLTIFTPNCLDQMGFDVAFINYQGQLAGNSGGVGSNVYISEQEDTWILESQSEQEVVFSVVGHYIDMQPGESMKDFEQREKSEDFDWSERFPIRMVNTAAGWRIDEYHSTLYW